MKSYKRKNHEKSVSPIRGNEEKLSRVSEDYRRLFLNLSEDYEILMKKYNILEK